MAVDKILAREWKVQIDSAGFTLINGLTTIGLGSDSTEADTTTQENEGIESHQISRRVKTITLSGKWLEDPATHGRDPGQAAVEALAEEIGASSIGDFKLILPDATEATFSASATMGDGLGDLDEAADWACTLKLVTAISWP